MRPWNEIIAEARDIKKEREERKRRLRIVKAHLKGSDALRKAQGKRNRLSPEELKLRERDIRVRERHQDTREQETQRKGAHSAWVIAQSKKNAEEKKKKELENIKNSPTKAASAALSDIKTQTISHRDSDATAYTKAIGNAASLAGGVAKAAIHYAVAKHKAKKAAAELEKKDSGGPPPPPPGGKPPGGGPPPPPPGGKPPGGGPPPPPPPGGGRKRLVPATKRLPPAGGSGKSLGQQARENPELRKQLINRRNQKGKSLGQQARENSELRKQLINQRNQTEEYSNWRDELFSENNSIENLHEFLPALLAALEAGGAAEIASVASGAGRAAAAGETGLGSKVSNVIKKTVKNKLGDGDNSSNSQSSSSSSEEPISSNDSSATAFTKALSNVGKIFSREEFVAEVEDKEAKRKKIIDVMRGKNKVELNPNMKEEKDQEGGMAHNELATMERAVKTLRKKIKSPNQQLPAWVQSKISKAADHIDTVADYMSGETEPVSEGYDDEYETFRQHSREPFSSLSPSERINRTAGVLKLMKQVNADVEKPKKKKKKKNKDVTEECGCEDDKKKVLAMMIIKKAIDAKKKKNFQLNSGIIGEESAAWQRKEGKNPEGGLNKKGIASYRREHPGSHLSLAVTTEPSKLKKGSKAANRRKSFCARMGGMPGPMKDEKGRPTRKALSLRKWNC